MEQFVKFKLDLEKVKFLQQNLERLNEYEKRAYDNGLQWGFTVTSKKHADYYESMFIRLGYYTQDKQASPIYDQIATLEQHIMSIKKQLTDTSALLDTYLTQLYKLGEQ
jgi:hypothetical protein